MQDFTYSSSILLACKLKCPLPYLCTVFSLKKTIRSKQLNSVFQCFESALEEIYLSNNKSASFSKEAALTDCKLKDILALKLCVLKKNKTKQKTCTKIKNNEPQGQTDQLLSTQWFQLSSIHTSPCLSDLPWHLSSIEFRTTATWRLIKTMGQMLETLETAELGSANHCCALFECHSYSSPTSYLYI